MHYHYYRCARARCRHGINTKYVSTLVVILLYGLLTGRRRRFDDNVGGQTFFFECLHRVFCFGIFLGTNSEFSTKQNGVLPRLTDCCCCCCGFCRKRSVAPRWSPSSRVSPKKQRQDRRARNAVTPVI